MLNEISSKKYNLIIGGCLFWGFVINTLMCLLFTEQILKLNVLAVIVVYFISCFAGIQINKSSTNPIISFIGYNMIVLPIGTILTIVLNEYSVISIGYAFLITTIVVMGMIIASIVKPDFFLRLGNVLCFSLVIVLIVQIVLLLTNTYTPKPLDYVVALIFSLFVGYDWAKAHKKQKTVDNAVDSACELYVDIINLFLRILRIIGKRK